MAMGRTALAHRGPFVAYLACRCCGHWWPVTERMFRSLIDPMRFVCPLCHEGRKKICDDWDQETRRPPVPAQLDIRVPVEEDATLFNREGR